jgi:hypothetical protein
MYYASVGPVLRFFDVDVDDATLTERGAIPPISNMSGRIRRATPFTPFPVTADPASPATNTAPMRLPSIR